MRHVIFILFFPNEQRWGGGRGAVRFSLLFSFPSSADYERDWPPREVLFSSFFGMVTNMFHRHYTVDPKLLPVGNPFKYHVVALYL